MSSNRRFSTILRVLLNDAVEVRRSAMNTLWVRRNVRRMLSSFRYCMMLEIAILSRGIEERRVCNMCYEKGSAAAFSSWRSMVAAMIAENATAILFRLARPVSEFYTACPTMRWFNVSNCLEILFCGKIRSSCNFIDEANNLASFSTAGSDHERNLKTGRIDCSHRIILDR